MAAMIVNANALHIPLRDKTIQTIVTSPPYYGLRDYGVADQIGLEPTPQEYIENLIAVFRECWRVLRDDGMLWLNLGDSYATHKKGSGGMTSKQSTNAGSFYDTYKPMPRTRYDVKEKNLIGIPWRVAFALQSDGWYLRRDIIWVKPNPMPESVTDRPTSSHEYVFLLTKNARYYYDNEAVKEPASIENIKDTALRSKRNSFKRGHSSRPDGIVPGNLENAHRENRLDDA
jgi:DNA modification methylase